MSDDLTRNMRKHKSALTRAKNTKDPAKIIAACDAALASFDTYGWPDCWSLWERERASAQYEARTRQLYHQDAKF